MDSAIVNAGEFNGISIGQRADGYVNITAMAKATGKRVDNWMRLDETTSFLSEFSLDPEYAGVLAIDPKQGRNGGTWVHPDVAIQFAQWVSPKFALFVSKLVRNWILNNTQAAPTPEPAPRQLSPEFFGAIVNAAEVFGLTEDPLLRAAMTQYMCEMVGSRSGSSEQTKQVVLTVRAAELGYSAKDINGGSQLGSFIVKQGFRPVGKTQHGRYSVNVFEWSEDLDRAIRSYFS